MDALSNLLSLAPNRWHPVALAGVFVARFTTGADARGSGCKVLDSAGLAAAGVGFSPAEVVCLHNHPRALRGMHADRAVTKVLVCLTGTVRELLVDLRASSPTRGRLVAFDFSPGCSVVVPRGVAHGFLNTGESDATVLIASDLTAGPSEPFGVRWDTVGYDWPISTPVVSARDAALPMLSVALTH